MVDVDYVIDFLNDLVKLDNKAVSDMLKNRIACNEEIANHPTLPVRETEDGYQFSILGILNGILGEEGNIGPICALINEDGTLKGFGKTEKFNTVRADIDDQITKFDKTEKSNTQKILGPYITNES